MKRDDPDSFQDAVEFDREIRSQPKLSGEAYLHRSLVPLDEVDFESKLSDTEGFLDECEGMCGI